MTIDQLDAARRRAITMLENFGDSDGAAEFESMTAYQYAEHKGIEVINSNPTTRRSTKKMATGLTKKQHNQLIEYIAGIVESAIKSNSRSDMRQTLEEISDLTDEDATLDFDEDGDVSVFATEPLVAGQDDDDDDEDE